MSAKPDVELILPLSLWKNSFNVKYLEYGKRCDVGRSIGTMNFDPG